MIMQITDAVVHRLRALIRRKVISIFAVAFVLWCIGYRVTEFTSPVLQALAIYQWIAGYPHSLTRREWEMRMAEFHLSKAVRSMYEVYHVTDDGIDFPMSWTDLINSAKAYQGPHLRGTLIEAFPFLEKPLDPWGRTWLFRVKMIERAGEQEVGLDGCINSGALLTFGSTGPDGIEEGPDDPRNLINRLIDRREFYRVRTRCFPPRMPQVEMEKR